MASSFFLVQRFLPFLRPYRGQLAAVLLATLLRPVLATAKVWLLKIVIDVVIREHRLTVLPAVCGAYLAITLARGFASFVDDDLGGRVGSGMVRDLRVAVYDHLQSLSLRFYHTRRLGDLLTRLTGDVAAIEDLLVTGLTDLLAQVLTVLLFMGMLLYLDASLALVALGVLPVLAYLSYDNARRSRPIQQETRDSVSALTATAEEALSAVALVKAFARGPFEQERFTRAATRGRDARRASIRLRAVLTPLVELVGTAGTVAVVWFGARAVLGGSLSLGGLVVFLGYLGSLYNPLQSLSRASGMLQRARVGAERVAELLDVPPELRERGQSRRLEATAGRVVFRDVTFGYVPGRAVLRGLNLTVRPGEVVGLVGTSGAGKTTVVSLLLAYYDPDDGVVAIDGQNLRHVDPSSARQQIAAVLQEPMLFHASIRENLRYGRLDATDAEIEEAARLVGADEFIRQLPEGYDTLVGPRGSRLSGGQRQRLAIARALLKDTPILILDEATSALDPQSEAAVLQSLRSRRPGQSTLLVAHRLSTLLYADRVVVLEGGQVVESGAPSELLARNGPFRRLHAGATDPIPDRVPRAPTTPTPTNIRADRAPLRSRLSS